MALGRGLEQLQPTQTKNLYQGNYLDFTSGDFNQWTQQFLPEVYDKEINIYGNRTLSGFLKMVSAEMPTTSDQIIWTEQGRLHTRYTNVQISAVIGSGSAFTGATFTVPATQDDYTLDGHVYRVGQTVMIQEQATTGDTKKGAANAPLIKGIITSLVAAPAGGANAGGFVVSFYETLATSPAGSNYTTLVYGSEYAKGTSGMEGTIHPQYKTYSNSPIIMKDHFAINGSDTSQIGWIEVDSENGASGYLWYMKSEAENRLRWEDYMELSLIEAVKADHDGATAAGSVSNSESVTSGNQKLRGTEGLFQSLETRGNVWEGLAGDLAETSTGTGDATVQGLDAFDAILKVMDKNAAVEENMLYVSRDLSLAFDDFMSTLNAGGTGANATSWGVFNNSKEMGLSLGFSSLRRGSYDFYKTDWKYLNDWAGRGGFGDIEGVLLPAGTSTVYDEVAGGNVKRPFCHVRYRASEADNRKMKSWITGSVGGAYTSDVDELRMHYLTERCLITQAANNFFLLKGQGASFADYNEGEITDGYAFQ